MIGIGRRIDGLRSLGVQHVFSDYTNPDAIIAAVLATRYAGTPRHE
jgi:hypothetical protein